MTDPRPTPAFAEVPPPRRLEQLWQQGQRPDVHRFVAEARIKAVGELAAVLAVDQWRRWHARDRVLAEAYLEHYPTLAENADAALDLIFGEVLVREELGETPDAAGYLRRFPRWAKQLRRQFDVHKALEPGPSSPLTLAPTGELSPTLDAAEDPATFYGEKLPAVPGYEVLAELGRGAMGVVYKARQLNLNRVVALKMVLAGSQAGPAALVRFLREAELAARLVHPNVVQVYEIGAHEGLPYFTQEYLEGGSLAARLAGKPLSPAEAAALVEQLAQGVQHAHERGVVHRDLKPGNILLTALGTPKVADFGLARWTDLGPGLTQSGAVVGTASYMAPEQAAGKGQEVGPAADVYALGAILYELLTGRPPFVGQSVYDTLAQVLTLDPVPPGRLQPKTPRDLETICLKCLLKEAPRRYASARALADDLRRFLRNEPIAARPPSALYRLRKFTQRQKVLVGGLTAVFLALAGGLLGTTFGMTRAWLAEGEARAESERASRAERDVRTRLAESYVQAGDLAVRRGLWRTALDNFNLAVETGHPDEVGLRLAKVRAWCALHEGPEAMRELQALSDRTDLGDRAGSVTLWQADLALARDVSDVEALRLVRKALDQGLPDAAEAAYARGLAAETSEEALGHFEEAVRLDPFYPRANGMLATVLLLSGRVAEARERVRLGELLFPEDPSFRLLHSAIQALDDDRPGAQQLLEKAQAPLGDRQRKTAAILVDFAHDLGRLGALFNDGPNASPAAELLGLGWDLVQIQDGFQAGEFPGLLLPVPPVLLSAYRPLLGFALLGLDTQSGSDALALSLQIHREGLLYFLLGCSLTQQERWEEAEQTFMAAAETPSLLSVRRAALFGAAGAQWVLGNPAAVPRRPEMLVRALEQTRKILALGALRPGEGQVLSQIALDAGEVDLTRGILADWERLAPKDPVMLGQRMEVEYRAGADGCVLLMADKLLALQPDEPKVKEWQVKAKDRRAQSAERLRQQVRALPTEIAPPK